MIQMGTLWELNVPFAEANIDADSVTSYNISDSNTAEILINRKIVKYINVSFIHSFIHLPREHLWMEHLWMGQVTHIHSVTPSVI